MKISSPDIDVTRHQPQTLDATPPATARLGNARLRLLDAGNREFEKGIHRGIGHRQSPELKAVKQAVRHYQAQPTPSLAGLVKIEQALRFWYDSGKNRSRQQDPVLTQLVADIAARRQALEQGGKAPSFQLSWLCNEQGLVNKPIESNLQIRQWCSELAKLQKEGAQDLFRHELQGGLDLMFGVSEEMMARRLDRAPTRQEVAESHEWQAFCGTLRQALPALGELKPQATAEENGRDILLTHSQLLEMEHLKEVLELSLAQKVSEQGEIGLLRTELLTALVDGLDEPFLQRERDEQALWQKPGDSSLRYETGIKSEIKHPFETSTRERTNDGPLARKEPKENIALFSASALVEAFAKIEVGKWEGKKEGALGEVAAKVTLTQENKATLKAEAVMGKAEGSLQFNLAHRPLVESTGDFYKPGPHDFTLLRVGASAELVSKLGLSVEGSWTIGQLLRAKIAGKVEVGPSVKVEAGAAVIVTPQGPVAKVTASASAFVGLKAEGSAELNLLKSEYANAYALSSKIRAAANLGAGAIAGVTAAIGPQGAKFHTVAGLTLGVGTEVGWEAGINAMATKSYALSLAARAVANFDQRKGDRLEGLAMAAGNENRLYELAQRVDSRIGVLTAQLDGLQMAACENQIRMQKSLIDPDIAAGRKAMDQAVDDLFGLERVDDQGGVTIPERAAERNEKLALTAKMIKDHAIKI